MSVFWGAARLCLLRNFFRFMGRDSLKSVFILPFMALFWAGGLAIFRSAFVFLDGFPGIGPLVAERLLYIAFGSVFFMLTASTAVISYSSHYRSAELPFLFSTPVPVSSVFMYKSALSVLAASWASVLLLSPMIVAYGMSRGGGAFFYLLFFILFAALACISGMAGVIIITLAAGRLSEKRVKVAGTAAIFALLAAVFFAFRLGGDSSANYEYLAGSLNRLLGHTEIFLFPFLPGYWITEALFSYEAGDGGSLLLYSSLLLSTAAVSVLGAEGLGRRIYLDRWLEMEGSGAGGPGMLAGKIDALLRPLGRVFPREALAFASKDIKTFLRDPGQWSQALILFGLLAAYIVNLGRMPYDIELLFWRNLILFLNVFALITILGMLSTRFAFPLVSLEGKRLWISFFSGVSLRRIVMQKFCLTGCGLFVTGALLSVMLNTVLGTGLYVFLICLLAVGLASFAFAGLSVGMGAVFPDFGTDNLSRINSGFGSSALLVLTLVYICLLGAAGAFPLFFTPRGFPGRGVCALLAAAAAAAASAAAGIIPLRAGIKSLGRMDF